MGIACQDPKAAGAISRGVQVCGLDGCRLGLSPAAGVAGRMCVRDVVTKLQREVVLAR